MSRVFDEWWHSLTPEEQIAHDRDAAAEDEPEASIDRRQLELPFSPPSAPVAERDDDDFF